MNVKIKKEKGITLITLTVAICILIIILSTLIYNAQNGIKMRNLKMMQNDIEILNDKIEQIFMANHLFEIGKSQVNYNNIKMNIYNKERMLIELIRNKNTFAFDYYKEIISHYREIADEIDMSLLADYLECFANGKNIFEIMHREVF